MFRKHRLVNTYQWENVHTTCDLSSAYQRARSYVAKFITGWTSGGWIATADKYCPCTLKSTIKYKEIGYKGSYKQSNELVRVPTFARWLRHQFLFTVGTHCYIAVRRGRLGILWWLPHSLLFLTLRNILMKAKYFSFQNCINISNNNCFALKFCHGMWQACVLCMV